MDDKQRLTGYRGCDTLSGAASHNGEVAYFVVLADAVIAAMRDKDDAAISKSYITAGTTLPAGTIVTSDQIDEGYFSYIETASGTIMMYDRPQINKPGRPFLPNDAKAS